MQISQARLEEVQRELGALADKLQPLQLRYESEKERLDNLRSLQQKKEDLQVRLQQAENRLDTATVADIRSLHHLNCSHDGRLHAHGGVKKSVTITMFVAIAIHYHYAHQCSSLSSSLLMLLLLSLTLATHENLD